MALACGVPACVRDAEPALCPEVVAGDLVITELRGAQSGGDTYGQWVELYNASGADLDLLGLHLEFTRIDGGAATRVIVRDSLPVAAGGYVVLGRGSAADHPTVVDYPMGTDYAVSWFNAAGVKVTSCDLVIDAMQYSALPTGGTYSLGVAPPTATANDTAASWCTNAQPGTDTTQLGLPGSPGAANPPCAIN
ncbi:MAG: lamin tail domain-containing protein [Deltaproteobacteria bacterium]|nr:lamin tail domain-containing protein [Deltaproteobacteria bacterium]